MSIGPWDGVRFFLAVARSGRLAPAARTLRVSVATVQRQLERIERDLGTRLFDRSARGDYTLTEPGRRTLPVAERLEQAALDLAQGARMSALVGEVKVSAPELLATLVIVPLLGAFRQVHPHVTVLLAASNLLVELSRGEADLALRLHRPKERALHARRLGRIAAAFYAAPSYLASTRSPPGTLDGHDLIVDGPGLTASLEMRWLQRRTRAARVVLRSDATAVRLQAALAGMGITFLPRFAGDRAAGLRRLELDEPLPTRELWLALPTRLRDSGAVRALVDYLARALRDQAAVLDPP